MTIYCEEETRRFRLQIHILNCEKDDLHNTVAQSNDRVNELESCGMQVKNQLDKTIAHLEKTRLELRVKSRDTEMLKVCKVSASEQDR